LGDQGSGKTEGFGKIFVSHHVPSHGKFSKDEEGWGGPSIRNERDKLRGFKPVPRSFVVHVRYTDKSRLLTAWKGALRSILEWMITVGMAGIKLIGFSERIQRVGKGYDRSGWEGEFGVLGERVIPKTTVTTPGDNIRSRWKREAVGVGFYATYSIAAELAHQGGHFNQKVTVMTG
jgi:hypothetical protein